MAGERVGVGKNESAKEVHTLSVIGDGNCKLLPGAQKTTRESTRNHLAGIGESALYYVVHDGTSSTGTYENE